MFIVIEGPDGCGKGTQSKRLAEALDATLMKYPDRTTPIGKIIDHWLKGERCLASDGASLAYPPLADEAVALQAMLLANKIEVQPQLAAALALNGRVVADRYAPSAIAYGAADGLDARWLRMSHSALIQPDLYILLDVSLDTSMKRIAARSRATTGADDTYGALETRIVKAAQNYRQMASADRSLWEVVNGEGSIEHVWTAITQVVLRRFNVTLREVKP